MDAKAPVQGGPLARGGKHRVPTVAADPALHPDALVTPGGIALPASDALLLSGMTATATRACLVAWLVRWWAVVHERFPPMPTLVITLANGPEHHRRRTQGMRRLGDFAHDSGLPVRLAYSPPEHRKDHPSERGWGILANHWH